METIYLKIYHDYIKEFDKIVSKLINYKFTKTDNDIIYIKNLCQAFINNRYKNKKFKDNNLTSDEFDTIIKKFKNELAIINNIDKDNKELIKTLLNTYYIYISNTVLQKCFK